MNHKGQEHWMDEGFSKKLKNYEVSPGDHVWDHIAEHLDGQNRRSGILGGWWTWLLIGILIGIGALMLLKKYNTGSQNQTNPQELPYRNLWDDQKGTASLEISDKSSAPAIHAVVKPQSKKVFNVAQKQNHKNFESIHAIPVGSSDILSLQREFQLDLNQELSMNYSNQGNNDQNLIASSDPDFLSLPAGGPSSVSFSSLPNKLSEITSENALKNPMILEGCNVHKNYTSHYFIEGFYAPEIASRSFIVNNPALLKYAEERAASEKPMLSYSSGIRGSVVFGSGLTFRTGLQFSTNTERFDFIKETLKITVERKDQNGNITTEIVEKVVMDKTYNRYRFVDIPIMIGYEKDLKDFVLSLNTGIGFNISTSQSGKIYQPDLKSFYSLDQVNEGNNPIYRDHAGISFLASIGLNYKLNQRTMLMLEPSMRYYTSSISDSNYPIQQKYFFGGVNIGLRYRIQ